MIGSDVLLEAVSVTSAKWQSLFYIYLVIAVVASTFFVVWIVYLVVSTRPRPGRPDTNQIKPGVIPSATRGRPRVVLFLVLFLAVVFYGLFAYSLPASYYMKDVPSQTANELHITVYAQQWSWTFEYPNGYNVTSSALHSNFAYFPTNTTIVFNVTSKDVMHEFSIPAFEVKVDAFPGVWNSAWTYVNVQGTYQVFCTELCGTGHADMWTNMSFVSPIQYQNWIATK